MSFTSGIPASGQSLGQTRDAIRNNFTNYNNLVSVDHVPPNDPSQGQHEQVTYNTYQTGPYPQTGTQSYEYSYNASGAGTQLVYQPSVVAIQVPASPRSLARVTWNGSTWSLGNGPYGSGTNFNVGSVTTISGGFTYNFSSNLASNNYFVFVQLEGAAINAGFPAIQSKSAASFNVLCTVINGSSLVIMVY